MTFGTAPQRVIETKRDGGRLAAQDIAAFVEGFSRGTIPDFQMAALAMAIYFQGMDLDETTAWTAAMWHSGSTLRRLPDGPPRVDKHSTGGVGDKVSLVLAPLVAAAGLHVPMISGRGLGHTGGTLDKLESIPNLRTQLSEEQIEGVLQQAGCVICGATATLVPADRRLYALRDLTATVPSVPLIVSSILSKKLAENLDGLVLDVKWGLGALMSDIQQARNLADALVAVGSRLGLSVHAVLSNMDQPLGRAIGNSVEVLEALDALRGRGPGDVVELVLQLGALMLLAAGRARQVAEARQVLSGLLHDGTALRRFERMVAAQGGDLEQPLHLAPAAEVVAPASGFVTAIDAGALGRCVARCGGGRVRIDDPIDHSVGVKLLVVRGEQVAAGQPLARVHVPPPLQQQACRDVAAAIQIGPQPAAPAPLWLAHTAPS
jgi:pyrimidine-nucleoside phosphorylase